MTTPIGKQHATVVAVQPVITSPKVNRRKKQGFTTLRLVIFFAMMITMALSAIAEDEVVGAPSPYQNPIQVALKEWYPANLSAILTGPYYNFSTPGSVLFDGSNMWISHASNSGNSVDKVQVSDNKKIATYPVGGASAPAAFDGVNIWLPDHQPSVNSVHRLRAADGAPLSACSLGSTGYYPSGMAFDGKYMWVGTNYGSVVKLDSQSCAIQCTTNIGSRAYGLAYDGNGGMWVTAVDLNAVIKLSSACIQSSPVYVGNGPVGIVFDGTYLWTANEFGNSTSQVRVSTSTFMNTYALGAGFQPWLAAYDGANVWITDFGAGKVSKIPTANPAARTSFPACGSASSTPLGLAFDGAHMWIGCEGINAVGKM